MENSFLRNIRRDIYLGIKFKLRRLKLPKLKKAAKNIRGKTHMEYIIIGIFAAVILTFGVVMILKFRKKSKTAALSIEVDNKAELETEILVGSEQNDLVIQPELLPADFVIDNAKLVEISDNRVIAQVNNLIPELAQIGNSVNNAVQTLQAGNLYRAIIPAGTKLADSRSMEGAVRGIYHGAGGIKGQANLVAVEVQKGTAIANSAAAGMDIASMIVGQYYMAQINSQLEKIGDGISQIIDFQNNEYQSRVISLVAYVKEIADFQTDILENSELRLSKISQLDNLEEECTKLLGQANLTLVDYTNKTELNYGEYEKTLGSTHSWFMYQKALMDILYKISDLKYTLQLGAASRELCTAMIPTYANQVFETRERLAAWHRKTIERLKIDINQTRRKRDGFDRILHSIPGLFNNDFNFCSIEQKTAAMITAQTSGYEAQHYIDTSELYNKDVQLILKDNKVYYLPE